VAGRSIAFDPKGDTVAFFARKGKRRSLYLASVLNGKILRRVPMTIDQTQAPCLLADGQHVLLSGIKDGVSDIYQLDMASGYLQNLTQDSFYDNDPQISPDGKMVAYTRRVSGHEKIFVFPLANPDRKTQLTFGAHDDAAPVFSPDGQTLYYASTEDDEIFNLRNLDLRTGIIRQYTDALGGNMAPAVVSARGSDRVAFISYFKGEYRLQTVEATEPVKEVEQEVLTASDEGLLDFQPEVVHQVVAENKRRKKMFEKLYLEGRPPLNVGVTSSGDFFGGSQVALADVLGDHSFVITAVSLREFRSYDGTYINLSRRFHYGFSLFDNTRFFFPQFLVPQFSFSRDGAFATQRYTGGSLIAQYPLDKFRRLEFQAGILRQTARYEDPVVQAEVELRAAELGIQNPLNNGTIMPMSLALVGETTRFREFGPLSGTTYSLGVTYSPSFGGALGRVTLDGDIRKYLRIGSGTLLATRVRGFRSSGDRPDFFYFGGNMELRGYPYLSFAGNEGFFANVEFRFPVIDVMKTPLGILGPVRGTLFGGVGGAHFRGEPFKFGTSEPGVSFVNDPIFGEPVSGFHLVDGRASYGIGLQFFFLGYPLHFDWSKLTDFQKSSSFRFDFWVGFDF
jgi:hypothetical protein